jgi:hypothetical protein
MCLTVPSVVIGVSNRVLHVAGDIMGGALGLVDFAFRLQLLIAGYLAGCVLDGPCRQRPSHVRDPRSFSILWGMDIERAGHVEVPILSER